MVISWALPAALWENHQVKPLEYLGSVISNKAPGGLPHHLHLKYNTTPFDFHLIYKMTFSNGGSELVLEYVLYF
jgi:hypothetical protein